MLYGGWYMVDGGWIPDEYSGIKSICDQYTIHYIPSTIHARGEINVHKLPLLKLFFCVFL